MIHYAATSDERQPTPLPLGRLLLIAAALLAAISCGCSQLRLPAIDPTGSCIFAPQPYSTTLALPEGGCCDPLRRLHDRLKDHGWKRPKSAFPEPAKPPKCATPTTPGKSKCQRDEACVPSAPCNGSCKDGPPAVLFGNECDVKKIKPLPNRGKRGCILLSPTKVVAPVGGEVVLLSGICGTDGYLQMNEQLEWMLTPESVGTFIQVGDDDPGLLHRLVGSKERPKKHDPSYARGVTSTKRTLITRGNMDPRDDVQLEKGQTWITISSPSEGTSRVTVLAPDSECWDQRKATATIYWVDARWQFPGPQVVPAGQAVELTTRVTRSEGGLPARGWKVRYEILQPELATFAGTGGASVVEATVDDSGNAVVQLVPNPGTSGNATIDMQVIRPGGESDNIPTMTLGRGQTLVTWSSPQLAVRAGAPAVASFDVPFQVVANVSNPGNQAATNVRVDVQLPPGARVTSADSFARVLPNAVTWVIDTIPAQTQLDLFMNVAAQSPISLTFQARGDGLVAEDTVRVDIFRPSLSVTVTPLQQRVEAGQRVTFDIDVTNTGDRPLQNVNLTATGDDGMVLAETGQRSAQNRKDDGPLQPGQTWGARVVFIPTRSGQRCINIDAFADGGQRASQAGCVTVINPVPKTPALSATLDGRDRIALGQTTLIRARVVNSGQGAARNVRVTMVYDPQIQLSQATEGADETRVAQNLVAWTLPVIEPGAEAVLEGQFNAVAPNPRARVRLSAESVEGAAANTDFVFEIVDTTPPPSPPRTPTLPPAQPAPDIPGGPAPAPLQGAPPPTLPAAPAAPRLSERLQVQLFGRDNPVRVNQDIRYSLRVVNDSRERDGEVLIQLELPTGAQIVGVSPLTNPELSGEVTINAGVASLAVIPLMRPGESVEYEIVLRSNQPREAFDLRVQVRSLRMPDGVLESVTTTVVP